MNRNIWKVSLLALCISPLYGQNAAATAPVLPPQALWPANTSPSNGDLNPYGIAFVPNQIPVSGTQGLNTVLNPGDILVSNFNNGAAAPNPITGQLVNGAGNAQSNLQGLGTTITQIQSNGLTTTFFQTPQSLIQMPGHPGVGFTNALVCLQNGMVIVGNLPTTDGTFATVGAGSLLFIRRDGTLSTQISYQPTTTSSAISQTALGFVTNSFFGAIPNVINGPWSLAVNDNTASGNSIQLFLSNVLAGTVVRFHITFDSDGNGVVFDQVPVTIVQNLNHENDANFFLLGPSGLTYDPLPSSPTLDTLFISNSKDNAIYFLQGAGWNNAPQAPQLLVLDLTHMHGPLGLALAPNGNLYSAQMDGNNVDPNQPSEIVLYDSVMGTFQGQFSVDPQNGGAFAVAFQPMLTITRPTRRSQVVTQVSRFAAVNDNFFTAGTPLSLFKTPTLNLWTLYQ